MTNKICPVCNAEIPVQRKSLPHDHDVGGVRLNEKEFDVMVPHLFNLTPGLSQCGGSGAIFEINQGS